MTITGDLASGGRLALAEVARVAEGLQGALERIALVLSGRSAQPGRRPLDVVDATRLDLVDLRSGSGVLVLERHGVEPLFDSPYEQAMASLVIGVSSLVADPETLPAGFDQGVIGGLVELTGSIGGGVGSITVSAPGFPPLVIDRGVKEAARLARRSATSERRTVVGRLHMGDFAPLALRCRVDTALDSVACDFEAELRSEVLAAMDRIVRVEGWAEVQPSTGTVRVLHIEGLDVLEDASRKSLEALMAEQGVGPIPDASQLAGEPIPDDEFASFLAAVRSLRGR